MSTLSDKWKIIFNEQIKDAEYGAAMLEKKQEDHRGGLWRQWRRADVIEEDARDSVRWKQMIRCDDREQPEEEDKQNAWQ